MKPKAMSYGIKLWAGFGKRCIILENHLIKNRFNEKSQVLCHCMAKCKTIQK